MMKRDALLFHKIRGAAYYRYFPNILVNYNPQFVIKQKGAAI